MAILGGAKVSDKIGVIQNLMKKVDSLIIGGGMAYTFLKAQGQEIGKSLLEADKVELARELLEEAKKRNLRFLLPMDHVVAMKPELNAVVQQIGEGQPIPADKMATRYWSEDDRIVFRRDFASADDFVERADGSVRSSRIFARDVQDRASDSGKCGCDFDCRAAEIRWRRFTRPGWPTRSRIFLPVAERRWNFWKERNCRESRR